MQTFIRFCKGAALVVTKAVKIVVWFMIWAALPVVTVLVTLLTRGR